MTTSRRDVMVCSYRRARSFYAAIPVASPSDDGVVEMPALGRMSFRAQRLSREMRPTFWNFTLPGQPILAFGIMALRSLTLRVMPKFPSEIVAELYPLGTFTRENYGPVLKTLRCERAPDQLFTARIWDGPRQIKTILVVTIIPTDGSPITCVGFVMMSGPSRITPHRIAEYDYHNGLRF